MDDVLRGRRLLLIAPAFLIAAGAALGCGATGTAAPHEIIGASRATVDGRRSAGAPDASTPSPVPNDFRTTYAKKNHARASSRGHGVGRWDADVYASRDAEDAWTHDRGTVAVGARFVEEHFEHGAGGAGPLYMMEKREAGYDATHGDWRYVIIDARGAVAKDGPLEACATCHADAPHDYLFRTED